MPPEKPRHQRKSYFTHNQFQFTFIIKFCLLLLAGVILSTTLLLLFSQGSLTSTFQNSRLIIKHTSLAILPAIVYTNLITLGLISIGAIFVTMLISHRIFGPLVRLEKELLAIGSGDLTGKLVLREKDQLTSIANSINTMTADLHVRVSAIRTEVQHLRQAAAARNEKGDLADQLSRLEHLLASTFKLHSR